MSELDARLAGLSPERRALVLRQLAQRKAAAARPGVVRRERPARLPLSFAQQRLWILDQFEPGSAVYNVPLSQWIDGPLRREPLQRALDEVARRHESLRTVTRSDADGPYQHILAPAQVPLGYADLSDLPAAERDAQAIELARKEAAIGFDLSHGPILRALLVRTGPQRHLLVLNAHHIAIDGWSLGVILEELHALYQAFDAGQPSPLADPQLQYVDYALWQRDEFEHGTLAKQLEYWKERLSGRLPVLELPGDRPRPPRQSPHGAVLRAVLPEDAYERVRQMARREDATAFMVLVAAFQTLLMRYSGQTDQVLGVGVANRGRPELESMVGFFVNMLALRNDLSGDPSFRELLAQVKETTLGAYSNQDLPIERLIEELDLDRAQSHTPLFQSMLFFQNFPGESRTESGLRLNTVAFDTVNQGTSRTDLSLFAVEDRGQLVMMFEYSTALFDEATIAAFAGQLQRLLAAAAEDPARTLGELDILSPLERRQLLRDWNDTAADTPALPLHGLFEAQAARTPAAIAVESGDQRLSYAELDAQAEAVARALAARGVGAGDLVGLYLERSPAMLAALLGTLKAGAAYVPMDPSYPAQRLGYMLEDASMRLVLGDRDLIANLPAGQASLSLKDALADAGAARAPVAVGACDPAYVIFTSGSTGRPKGVRVPHGAAANFLASMAREPGLGETDALCAVTTLSFDIALLELMLPLSVGARVVLADRDTAGDAMALARLIERSRSTVVQATPATWRMLLDAGWHGRADLRLLCGGEALPRELADRLLERCGELWNMYGPTETTVWSTLERVRRDGAICIGKPIANTRVYVVDRALRPLPAGVPGELLIGGDGVALGYLDRPELTAEKFVPDPYAASPDARLYRTGDLARWRRDGRLEVIGRIDHQVKLRGFRIELGEIESVLAQLPGVGQAVVHCREDRPGDKRLVAYVVADGDAPAAGAMREHLRASLPDYMVPSAFATLERFPLTPNGKVDRNALPAPDNGADSERYVAPRNDDEARLAEIWAQTLGIERVGIDDDFFDLGGHSLLATQLLSRINQAFACDARLRTVFEAPTVAGFGQWLQAQYAQMLHDDDGLAGMLDNLEGLSDEEIQALLSEQVATGT
ncbi:non-ribosomal peptide synthetase [Lysobacter enzymogenes]|uniref:non-ribosomal peptide synthetase n=1 Tax=Lysobacter enzymogenes TaxID=69 RepID=UPI001AF2AE15|nr:amino acid adenylation domain-containing protein [Lysobacter enzymogenes]QQQ00676.1 amino acid adenylation domain-containing protein [Lysobacter enzymogenes]